MKLSILPRLYACAVFSTLIATFCHCQMTPEDLLTDSDEQLDKLKRDDFVDSILEQFPSLEPLGEPSEEDKENNEKEKDSQHAKNEPGDAAKTAALSSVFPSPSAFTFASIKTSNISTSNSVSTSAAASNKTVLDNSTYVRPTGSVYNLHSSIFVNQTNTKDLAFQTRELLIDKSATHSINDTKSTMNVLQSSSLVSTINSSMSSVVISTSPAVHSPSIVSDTAQSKIQPTSTSFVGDAALVSSTIKETPKIVSPIVSLSSTKVKVSTSPGSSGRKMPVTPDESRFGGFIPTAVKNEKGISFVYVNVLLPIVAGITGALFIIFAILLFRCCRRRKLTKVRYFGAKHKRDFVHLDQMNLLTDTSDEDDFD